MASNGFVGLIGWSSGGCPFVGWSGGAGGMGFCGLQTGFDKTYSLCKEL